MTLTLDQVRVEDRAAVVARDDARDLDGSGVGVELDDDEMRSERERRSRQHVVGRGRQALGPRGLRDFGPAHRLGRCALHVEERSHLVEHDVVRAGFEKFGRELAGLVYDLGRAHVHRGAARL